MSNKKYLDYSGLSYFWNKVKLYFQEIYSPLVHTHTISEVTNLEKLLEYLMNGAEPGVVRCVYNATSTSNATTILNSASNISKMWVDGLEKPVATDYTFPTTGKHTVDFKLSTNTTITSNTFGYCTSLVSVVIPESVTSIGEGVFANCSGLTSVTIPNSVTSIGIAAFYQCSALKSITIPNSVTSIGSSAFYGCSSLTSINIPNSITSISNSTFYGCSSLTSIEIPNSVTSIVDSAFYNCSNLNEIRVKAATAPTLANNVFSGVASSGTLYYPKGSNYSTWIAALPVGWSAQQVDTLEGLTNHELNNTIHITAAERTTWNAKQDALTFDSYPAKDSTNPVTSEGIRRAIDEAMSGSSESINCIYNVSSTSSATKLLDSLTGVSAIYIDGTELSPLATSYQFSTTGNHTVNIIPSGNSMPQFENVTSLSKVETIPNNITTIGNSTFEGCTSLYFINLPDKLSSIGSGAFYNCSELTTGTDGRINLPDSVERIGENAFYGCAEMYSLVLPTEIQSLGDYAFANNISLNKIIFKGPFCPSIGSNAFNNIAPSGTLYYNPAIEGEYSQSSLESLLPSGWTAVPIEGLADSTLDDHQVNTTVHITSAERATWNAKQNALTSGNLVKIDSGTLKLKNNTTEISAIIDSNSNTAAADTNIFTAKKVDDVYQKKLTFDDVPTQNSSKPVKSGGVYSELAKKQDNLTIDNSPTSGNTTHVVSSDGIYQALSEKQNNLSSGNLVKIDGSTLKIKNGSDEISAIIKSGNTTTPADTNMFTAKKVDDVYQKKLTIDTTPTQASGNPISSGAVFTHTSNPDIHVTTAEKATWNAKQDALTIDSAPTSGNTTHVVSSDGVYTAISNAIAGVTQISYEVITGASPALPQTGEVGKIYLLPNTASGGNGYDEYIWVPNGSSGGTFELIGPKDLDLSGYVTYDVYNALNITNSEIDSIDTWPTT